MRPADLLHFSGQALLRQRFRSAMILLAMGLGVAAVVVLTALGEGARGYVVGEFSSIGKDLLVMFPGRKETTGGMPPVTGAASRDITLDEVARLQQRVSALQEIAPMVVGSARVGYGERGRDVTVLGSTPFVLKIQNLTLAQGSNLPAGDFRLATGAVIIGQKLEKELFGARSAVGEFVRIGDSRFRVVGILEGRGDSFGMDLSDAALIPVAAAQRLFNAPGLFRVVMQVREGRNREQVRTDVENAMRDFHQGELDVTLISPDAMLQTFDAILVAMTLGVAAIGAISLLVAGVLIMNVMLITVSQRTREIGLMKALGASSADVLRLFLAEALLITGAGAAVGVAVGLLVVWLARQLFPSVPFQAPLWVVLAAALVALLTGLAFSWLPARRASRLQPVAALQQP